MTKTKESIKVRRWGRWYLDTKKPVSLNIMLTPYFEYWIDLAACQSESQRDQWVRHIRLKRHISQADLDDLAAAFRDLEREGLI